MPCFKPMVLFRSLSGPNPKTGKWPLSGPKTGIISNPVQVPCGRCIGCRLERSRQWAIRCVNEAQMHQENCFVTLTLRTEELLYGGEATLYPRHLTLFFKRLRKKYGTNIKYFACGEYGERFGRPHYHACIFGLDFEDKTILSSKDNINLYHSVTLDRIWTHGTCTIGDVNFDTAAYVARYVMKKKLGKEKTYYEKKGIEPEFTRMSRRPGIGSTFYDKFKDDIYPHDYMVIRNGLKCRPTKYYNNKYEIEKPEIYEGIKSARKAKAIKNEHDNTRSRLKAKETVKKSQIKSLTRNYDEIII